MVVFIENTDDWKTKVEGAGDKLVVIDFTATWCGPCRMIGPKFEEMSKEFTDVLFFKVDVDKNSEVAEKQGISAMPTFKCYRNGKMVAEFCGANEAKLREMIEKNK